MRVGLWVCEKLGVHVHVLVLVLVNVDLVFRFP